LFLLVSVSSLGSAKIGHGPGRDEFHLLAMPGPDLANA
jgi:hypothetical protein